MIRLRSDYVACAFIMVFAGTLRFSHLDAGFTENVECMYTHTAYTIALLVEWSTQQFESSGSLAEVESLMRFFAAKGHVPRMPYSCKPVYDLTNAFALSVSGLSDKVLPFLSAVAGTLAIGAIFLVARRLYGNKTGLCAAVLLAVSGSGLVFSRYGQSHMLSLLFLMLGMWMYLQSLQRESHRGTLIGCGLFFGLAVATHPNLVPYVGLFAIYEVGFAFKRGWTLRLLGVRVSAVLGTVLALAFLLNLPFTMIGHYFGAFFEYVEPKVGRPFLTYFEQLPRHYGQVFPTESMPSFADRLYTYLVVFWAWEGVLITLLVVGQLIVFAVNFRTASAKDVVVYSQLVVPMAFWILYENQAVFRFAAGTVPVALIIAAHAVIRVGIWSGKRLGRTGGVSAPALVLGGVVVAYGLINVSTVYSAQSGYRAAAHWIQDHEVGPVATAFPLMMEFYGRQTRPVSQRGLSQSSYLCVNRRYLSKAESEILSKLQGRDPDFSAPHLRPGKLLEVQLMEKSWLLRAGSRLPLVGKYLEEMRATVLGRNATRRVELYDIRDSKNAFGIMPFFPPKDDLAE